MREILFRAKRLDNYVRYLGGMFSIKGDSFSLCSSLCAISDFKYVMRGRVAGNIFDNPELLEEGAK